MQLIQKQLSLEQMKEEISTLNLLRTWLFNIESKEQTLVWVTAVLTVLLWLLSVAQVFPWGLTWLGPILLMLFAYGLFKQAERYRLPYYESLGIKKERWVVRRNLADLERIRDLLKAKGLYRKGDVEAFIEQITADLDLKYVGIWQHPLYLFVLGLFASSVIQSTGKLSGGSNPTILVLSLVAFFLAVTVVPQLYDIFTERRRLLNYLLKCSITISSDFKDHKGL